jgi:hypothetical protein
MRSELLFLGLVLAVVLGSHAALADAVFYVIPVKNPSIKTTDSNTVGVKGTYDSSSTGTSNTAAGSNALHSNTTGYWNTADSSDAFFGNSSGSYNIALGKDALWNNSADNGNTELWHRAGCTDYYQHVNAMLLNDVQK